MQRQSDTQATMLIVLSYSEETSDLRGPGWQLSTCSTTATHINVWVALQAPKLLIVRILSALCLCFYC